MTTKSINNNEKGRDSSSTTLPDHTTTENTSFRHLFSFDNTRKTPVKKDPVSAPESTAFRIASPTTAAPPSPSKQDVRIEEPLLDTSTRTEKDDNAQRPTSEAYVQACDDDVVRSIAVNFFDLGSASSRDDLTSLHRHTFDEIRDEIRTDFKLRRQNVVRGRNLGSVHQQQSSH